MPTKSTDLNQKDQILGKITSSCKTLPDSNMYKDRNLNHPLRVLPNIVDTENVDNDNIIFKAIE